MAIKASLYEVQQDRSKDFSDYLSEALQQATRAKKEFQEREEMWFKFNTMLLGEEMWFKFQRDSK